jgi:4-diphosphocytidyl-2-C-methyl-D-erythritol kinase
MPQERSQDHVIRRRAFAKVNLGLHVLRRRADGYHDVETVLLAVELHDTVTYRSERYFSFTCSDPDLPSDSTNLCVRAAHHLAAAAGIEPAGHLHLEKQIPHGAGLGGGSSDAATVLELLNGAWSAGLDRATLHELSAALGSDVPFFLYGSPMLATGRGEVLNPITLSGANLPMSVAIAVPPVRVSTAEAYQVVTPSAQSRPDLTALLQDGDLSRWRSDLVNDFQSPIARLHPRVAIELEAMAAAGAMYHQLSGSGSAVFGLFESPAGASAAAQSARQRGGFGWSGRLLLTPPTESGSERSS